METLLTIFTVIFSPAGFTGWIKLDKSEFGAAIYMGFEKIRKHGEHVYCWQLVELLKPNRNGHFSYTDYFQDDCKLIRYRALNKTLNCRVMYRRFAKNIPPNDQKWKLPSPNSMLEISLRSICSRS